MKNQKITAAFFLIYAMVFAQVANASTLDDFLKADEISFRELKLMGNYSCKISTDPDGEGMSLNLDANSVKEYFIDMRKEVADSIKKANVNTEVLELDVERGQLFNALLELQSEEEGSAQYALRYISENFLAKSLFFDWQVEKLKICAQIYCEKQE